MDPGALHDFLGIRQGDSSLQGMKNGWWKMIPHQLLILRKQRRIPNHLKLVNDGDIHCLYIALTGRRCLK
jgi:hypothetical protein